MLLEHTWLSCQIPSIAVPKFSESFEIVRVRVFLTSLYLVDGRQLHDVFVQFYYIDYI